MKREHMVGAVEEVYEGYALSALKGINRATLAYNDLMHMLLEGAVVPDRGDLERVAAALRDARVAILYARKELRPCLRGQRDGSPPPGVIDFATAREQQRAKRRTERRREP